MIGTTLSELEKARYSLTIEQFLEGGLLVPLFQPIVSLVGEADGAAVYGYESTIRGPVGSQLQSPLELLAKATDAGLRELLELACCRCQIEQFHHLGLPGRLFLNLSSGALLHAHLHEREQFEEILLSGGVSPRQLVIELTENIPEDQLAALCDAMNTARTTGMNFALDNLGASASNLRIWKETQPEIVNIDRHLVNGIHSMPVKQQAVRQMVQHAESMGTLLLAKGIEHTADRDTLKDLGIRFGQGYLLGRPSSMPARPPCAASLPVVDRRVVA
jgi:EAL domain-containing protein (putative c-di-GMP-specific phosphodiesterase class I)